MWLRELLETQIKTSKPIKSEYIKDQRYTSGQPWIAGGKVLYVVVKSDSKSQIITLAENEIDSYQVKYKLFNINQPYVNPGSCLPVLEPA